MLKKLLNRNKTFLKILNLLEVDESKITFTKKPNILQKAETFMRVKNYKITTTGSVLRYPVVLLSRTNVYIPVTKFEKLLVNSNINVMKFIPNTSKYQDYSNLITSNLEYLYDSSYRYFTDVYTAFLNKLKIKAHEKHIEFNEDMFDLILFQINEMNLKTKEDITDELIINIIVDYIYSNLK